ncbi:MAG: Threonine-tRNA ligase [Candidatus Magasanikbacteria bacterium GW2011_GWD2_43_18]|uniref:Threonine--tRNA ligase n=1 Tax=Candidatus Magasanikbacteria bacterium GW2011_GWE2_42_7 TaxID=1619052 RepID=A0A0G1BHY4_9BACT|nr:MAG: Threonine-tRNA ligase [Candidatus Magasanikbacteria bacterium GW2011_GWC2_42_27]KKS72804.1 MAG: Threonine-tRNA ligase [Candidatus Magasanikbacteria bacterium GW2011_GWE2_42_7]KKT04030.1 MAG: Threonine-tRNA ligase [Candidatus Magasanikbacteria bacterium GW2011_GWD2_43_18]KKT24922.1 MAG: Threonine-tRNA ligase [Candidatus Magasanikbacteria bacterium GW2011_GWA2_43_9]HBB37937.1 threonine--tRNA ligase [Candidatus Magasanikbacteria bacterium]
MNNPEHLEHLRHSAAHLLAAAVLELYPDAKLTLGPAIESGFYYDIDFNDVTLSVEDLPAIEKKMKDLVNDWKEFTHREVSPEEAKEIYKGNAYKLEMIHDIAEKGEKITLYTCGNFTDLCRGGHVEEPRKMLRAFKLMSIAGAYWRGDEKNAMLTRIYGTAFETKEELKAHVDMLEEAKKRDHRKLGKELGLFVFSDLVGPGMPMYTPKGNIVRNAIVNFSRELNARVGFGEVHTPNMNKADLFRTSGHYDKYKDDMLQVVSHYTDEEYYLKPMNCPQHTQIYASEMRSYRDLPIRFADFANLYRDEKPGELSGLTRLRCFAQDDGHAFCRPDQIESEFKAILEAIHIALRVYGMEYEVRLSLRDPQNKEKYLGDDAIWDKAESSLRQLLISAGIEFREELGEAAFYGPKMDIVARDSLRREWQISTIQLDFNMPERFDLSYIDAEGNAQRPVMIHRALVGSPDRFMGIYIEHCAANFPVWMSPVQVHLVPVSEKHIDGARALAAEFQSAGIRISIDEADETVGKKIRNATKGKHPYILVVGDKELSGEDMMIRVRGQEEQVTMSKEAFIEKVKKEIATRA